MGIERTNVEVSRGEFVKPVPTASTPYTQAHKYHIMRDPTISFSCPQSNVAALTLQEYEFLNRSEVVPERRFTLYEYILKEPELLEASKRYNVSQPPPRKRPASFAPKVGSTVVVSDYGPYASSYYGVVRWIGQFDGQEEQMAGIELTCATLWWWWSCSWPPLSSVLSSGTSGSMQAVLTLTSSLP
ncbi:uncharacterized protein LOC135340815 [Halichondria panicea]|uniref:uncharacterized protein LOC135340815 n=1 Tax=Halichondria panicea TaxID=6063 RepID=UPI00312B6384